eukprot:CAMPEP_0195577756 /NCGR_PEP_ID=MMETSP0814-20130614/10869_1 /TAXON_ID=97485 /ORGANISM="Prymnesium parvum, Strain Texoma1" /LENGTH=200 /DNA_ID=CAMNT_0040714179 /DNA_START=280 /DNA_END=883 /DNA_ORIENTATION=+
MTTLYEVPNRTLTSHMGLSVRLQMCRIPKRCRTPWPVAGMRSLLRVDSLMDSQRRRASKCCGATWPGAPEGLLARVDAPVAHHRREIRKRGSALQANYSGMASPLYECVYVVSMQKGRRRRSCNQANHKCAPVDDDVCTVVEERVLAPARSVPHLGAACSFVPILSYLRNGMADCVARRSNGCGLQKASLSTQEAVRHGE